jgi:hydroxymethylglutaryl-CoA synthase
MMSTFESDYESDSPLDGQQFGLCGYGSGAKAKVFEGVVSDRWREVVASWNLFERMAGRMAIDQVTYELLHKGIHEGSVLKPRGEFALVEIEGGEGELEGARTYAWVE